MELVDVIVCAHNEEATIFQVVTAIMGSHYRRYCVVVADSCTDKTVEVARNAGAHVVEVAAGNKGSAMAYGLRYVSTRDIAFVDADLEGLQVRHIDALLTWAPGWMVVGIRDGHHSSLGRFPSISGERRVPRRLAEEVRLTGTGWKAELILNAACMKAGIPWAHVLMRGVKNPRRNKPDEWLKVTAAALEHAGPLSRMLANTRKVRP